MLNEKKQFGCLGKCDDARDDGVDKTNVSDAVLFLAMRWMMQVLSQHLNWGGRLNLGVNATAYMNLYLSNTEGNKVLSLAFSFSYN
jgi:hypothetical protein